MSNGLGMDEEEIRRFLEHQLSLSGDRSFYWESEESEEVVDLLVDLIAAAIAANNDALLEGLARAQRS